MLQFFYIAETTSIWLIYIRLFCKRVSSKYLYVKVNRSFHSNKTNNIAIQEMNFLFMKVYTGSTNSKCTFWEFYFMVFLQLSNEYLGRFLKLRHETIIWVIVWSNRMPHIVRIFNFPKIHFFHNLNFMKMKNLIFLFSCHRRLQTLAPCKIQVYQTW